MVAAVVPDPRTVRTAPVASPADAVELVNETPVEVHWSPKPVTAIEPVMESARADGAAAKAIEIARNPSVIRFMCFSYQLPEVKNVVLERCLSRKHAAVERARMPNSA